MSSQALGDCSLPLAEGITFAAVTLILGWVS